MIHRRGFLGLLGSVVAAPLAPSPMLAPPPPVTTIKVTVDAAKLQQVIREARAYMEQSQRVALLRSTSWPVLRSTSSRT